jgi:uncharacterized protein YqjF (DUF2071 family)
MTRREFLTARWEYLVLLNYAVEESDLAALVPSGTTLDRWAGETLISLVGFHFADTRVRGWTIPHHRNFEEVNLRFNVRRLGSDGRMRRGVVFIRELVPRFAIATAARLIYNEPYISVPMHHRIVVEPERGGVVEYGWRYRQNDFALSARMTGPPESLVPGSEAEFITEHYWGYTAQRDGRTLEYEVRHPSWRVWVPVEIHFDGPAATLYGPRFGAILRSAPRSAFVAEGSDVTVYPGAILVGPA